MTEHTSSRPGSDQPRRAARQRGSQPVRQRGGRHRRPDLPQTRNLRLLWAGQFVNTAGLMMLVPIMPFYVQRMGLPDAVAVQTWAGMAIAAPALALVLVTPLWGKLGDRIGRAAGFASTSGPKGGRGATLGKSFSATAAGALVGPIAGGTLVGSDQLSVLMMVIATAATALAITCAIGLREPPRSPLAPRPAGSPITITSPRKRCRVLTPSLAVAAVAAYLGVYGLIPVFAAYTQTLVAPETAGLWVGVAQSLTWGATLVSSPWWGRRNDTTGRPLTSFTLAAAGCGLAIAGQSLPLGLPAILGLRLIQGACFAALAQSLFFHASSTARADRRAGAVGVVNSFLLAGQSVGPLLAGPLVSGLPLGAVIAVLAASCLLAAAVAAPSATRTPRLTDTASAPEPTAAHATPGARRATSSDPPATPLEHLGTGERPRVQPRSISRTDLVSLGQARR